MTILTDITFACGHCKRLFNRNHKGEKIYLDLEPKNAKHQKKQKQETDSTLKSFNIFCSYCKKYFGKFEDGQKTYFPPQDNPATKGDKSHGICSQCVAAGAFENYKESN